MFTGIVEEIGTMQPVSSSSDAHQYKILASDQFVTSVQKGDSVAVNGVCLTVYGIDHRAFHVDVSEETQRCTQFSQVMRKRQVNLERAVLPNTRMGGHFVSGHVDGMATLNKREDKQNETIMWFSAPNQLLKYIAKKGSICVNGVSLTVNQSKNDAFCITIIPYTLMNTTLKYVQEEDQVNIEVDLIARYLEQIARAAS